MVRDVPSLCWRVLSVILISSLQAGFLALSPSVRAASPPCHANPYAGAGSACGLAGAVLVSDHTFPGGANLLRFGAANALAVASEAECLLRQVEYPGAGGTIEFIVRT